MHHHLLLHHEFDGSIYSFLWLISFGGIILCLKKIVRLFKKDKKIP